MAREIMLRSISFMISWIGQVFLVDGGGSLIKTIGIEARLQIEGRKV